MAFPSFGDICAKTLTYRKPTDAQLQRVKAVEDACTKLQHALDNTNFTTKNFEAWQTAIDACANAIAAVLPTAGTDATKAAGILGMVRMQGTRTMIATTPLAAPSTWRDDAERSIRDLMLTATTAIMMEPA
jgi:hypothetical protein